MSCNHISYILEKLNNKEAELQVIVTELHNPSMKITDTEKKLSKIHDEIRLLENEKETQLKRFSLFRENLTLKISNVHNQLEECLSSKTSYGKFSYPNLRAVEIASYGLCALLSISDSIKATWDK